MFILWQVFFKRVAKVPAWAQNHTSIRCLGRLPSQMFELRFSASLETIDLEPREQTPLAHTSSYETWQSALEKDPYMAAIVMLWRWLPRVLRRYGLPDRWPEGTQPTYVRP